MPKSPTQYSRIFFLVCNFPHEDLANEKELKIINGMKSRWAEEQNDPTCERVHIIYLDKDDSPFNKKFKSLRLADANSKIYIVGHCEPGSDTINSDEVYPDPADPNKLVKHGFSFMDLAFIFMQNINNEEVVIERESKNLAKIINSTRKLKICFPNCHAATDAKNIFGNILEASFAHKFFQFVNNNYTSILVCDIVAANAFVLPVGSKPGFINLLYFLNDNEKCDTGFHKLYLQSPYRNGNFTFNLFKMYPRSKPGNDYKFTFIQSPSTTLNEFQNGNIRFEKLDVTAAKQYRNSPTISLTNDEKDSIDDAEITRGLLAIFN